MNTALTLTGLQSAEIAIAAEAREQFARAAGISKEAA